MSMKNDSIKVAEIVYMLENGQYKERKQYIKELYEKGQVTIKGYTIEKDLWCWVIWKPTDIDKDPGFKGEPLVKVVPRLYLDKEEIEAILDAQPWNYI